MNEFERAEVRALASLLENWPAGDENDGARSPGAESSSTGQKLAQLRARAGDTVNEWLSVESAGRILGIGSHTVYGLINRGELVAYRIGRVYRIRLEDIAAFLDLARVKPGDLRHLVHDPAGYPRESFSAPVSRHA